MTESWVVYIVRCVDKSLYTGITTDLNRRTGMHNAGSGAKYTRSRRPVEAVYSSRLMTRSAALKEENRIKSLTRAQKLRIIEENS